MSDKPKTPAAWRTKIEQLETRLAEAEAGLEAAKAAAAHAVLSGDHDKTGEIATWRDRIDAVQTAIAEAQNGLQAAEDAVAAKDRSSAMKRALDAAKARHGAAQDFDKAMALAEDAYSRFIAAGLDYAGHIRSAGGKEPSWGKMHAGEAVRGAFTVAAYTLSGALQTRPQSRDSRKPLADFVEAQTPIQEAAQ